MTAVPGVVHIGGIGKADLRAALHRRGVQLNAIAETLFAHPGFSVADRASDVVIADLSVGELGHARGATSDEMFASAVGQGLSLCPLEVAPHLRMQFMDQPEADPDLAPVQHRAPPGALTIASPALLADDGRPMGFYLRRMGEVRWLRGYCAAPGHVWSAADRFIFCRAPMAGASPGAGQARQAVRGRTAL